jgi:hypothetical protein
MKKDERPRMKDIIQGGYNHHTFMSLRGALAAMKQSPRKFGDCFAKFTLTGEAMSKCSQ